MFRKKRKNKAPSTIRRRKPSARQAAPGRLTMWWRALQPQRRREISRNVGLSAFLVVVGVCMVLGLVAMEHNVLARPIGSSMQVRVEIANAPAWMPGMLQRHIEASLAPAPLATYDPQLPQRVYVRAQANAWIRSIQSVRRCESDSPNIALLQLRASFRKPVARIRTSGAFDYLDIEGVRLPASQAPRWVGVVVGSDGKARQVCFATTDEVPPRMKVRPVHYTTIDGVRTPEPPIGKVWPGADLAAGLKLLALISDRPYANQITLVDVRNHDGRISRHEPHLRLYAQVGAGKATDIKFGRFPRPRGDFAISPTRKVSYLDEYVARNGGRLAGLNSYLDLQYGNLHVSID